MYKAYAAKRPTDYCNMDDPFYIATNTLQSCMKANSQWFKRQPIDVNKLSSTMKRVVAFACIEKTLQTTVREKNWYKS